VSRILVFCTRKKRKRRRSNIYRCSVAHLSRGGGDRNFWGIFGREKERKEDFPPSLSPSKGRNELSGKKNAFSKEESKGFLNVRGGKGRVACFIGRGGAL